METVNDYYILFRNHTEGMALYQYIKQHGGVARICPVPRTASECCGMSLVVLPEDIELVCALMDESGIEVLGIAELPRNINPKRDCYC